MSSDALIHRQHVLPHYWRLQEALIPACHRCGYGGSLRRHVPEVKDIELICLPFYDAADPLKPVRTYSRLSEALQMLLDGHILQWDEANKKRGDLYKRFVLPALTVGDGPGIGVDLFLADIENYGYILMLRTGSADFGHAMVTPRAKGGLRPAHLRCKDGYVWRQAALPSGVTRAEKLLVPTEERLFAEWDLPYIPAAERCAEKVQEIRHQLGLPYVPALRLVSAAQTETTPNESERREAYA